MKAKLLVIPGIIIVSIMLTGCPPADDNGGNGGG